MIRNHFQLNNKSLMIAFVAADRAEANVTKEQVTLLQSSWEEATIKNLAMLLQHLFEENFKRLNCYDDVPSIYKSLILKVLDLIDWEEIARLVISWKEEAEIRESSKKEES